MSGIQRHAAAFLEPRPDGGFRVLVLEVVDCATARDFADELREFTGRHPEAAMRTWVPSESPMELARMVAGAMAGYPEPVEQEASPPPRASTREPVLPYLRQIADEGSDAWWTTRELVEQCIELGWSTRSERAPGTVVRRLPTLGREPGYEVEKRGRGRATRWCLRKKRSNP